MYGWWLLSREGWPVSKGPPPPKWNPDYTLSLVSIGMYAKGNIILLQAGGSLRSPRTKIGCMYIHSKAICCTGAFAKSWPYKGEINVMDTQLRSVGYWLCKQHCLLHHCIIAHAHWLHPVGACDQIVGAPGNFFCHLYVWVWGVGILCVLGVYCGTTAVWWRLLGEGVWYVICGHIICDGVSPIRLGHLVMVHVPNSRYAILQSYH